MKKSKILFSVLASTLMAVGAFSAAKYVTTHAEDESEIVVNYSADSSKWESASGATFGGEMKATSGAFDWVTKKSAFSNVTYETSESFELVRDSDWKYEYITISTTGEYGVTADATTLAKNSVSFVWGFIPYAQVVEVDAEGNTTKKTVGSNDGYDIVAAGLANEDYAASLFRHTFDRDFSISVAVTELDDGVKFDFTAHGVDEWGAYAGLGGITCTWSYTSTNLTLKGDRAVSVGRIGGGDVSETHTFVGKLTVDGANLSANPAAWERSTNAEFINGGMKASSGQYNWVTTPANINKVDLTMTETLEMNRDADWKWEYLTISTSGESGVDANGNTLAKNSVSFAWGWIPYAKMVEVDATGNVVASPSVGSVADVVPTGAPGDDNHTCSMFRRCFDRTLRVTVTITDLADGVKFDFTAHGVDEWNAWSGLGGINLSWSYTSTNTALKGAKSIAVGRLGNGTVDETHSIVADLVVTEAGEPVVDPFTNYTASADTMSVLTKATILGNKAALTEPVGTLVTTDFGADATIKYAVDFTECDGGWGSMVFVFKGEASDIAGTTWAYGEPTTATPTPKAGSNWVAFAMTHGKIMFYECTNGVASEVTTTLPSVMNGYSFWYLMNQKSEFTVTTEDTANGVNFTCSFKASGHDSNTGETYSCSFSVANKALWGKQAAGFVNVVADGTFNSSNNSIVIKALSEESEYNKELYIADKFAGMMSAISYEAVTVDNYSSLLGAYEAADAFVKGLDDTKKAALAQADLDKLAQLKSDLESVDGSLFAQLAIDALDIADFTRDNLAAQKALIVDAQTKYEKLTADEKAKISEADRTKLYDAVAALADFEDLLSYADPVVEMIDQLPETITNYGVEKRLIEAAKAAYDELFPEEKALVVNSEKLTAAVEALATYKEEHKNSNYNFATDTVNFAEISNFSAFSADANGLVVNGNSQQTAIYTTNKMESGKELTYVIDSQMTNGWANFFFVFRADSLKARHDGGAWLQEGNYTVLLMGSDGFRVVECVDGVLPMTKDAAGNPIAAWQVEIPEAASTGGSNYDVWHVDKNYTILTIKTVDNFEDDVYVGYTATFTLIGGVSGVTTVREYTSTNPASKDALYAGLELYCGGPINEGNGNGFLVEGIYFEGVTSYDGAAVKAEMVAKQHAANVDALLRAVITDAITADNYDAAKAAVEAASAAYDALTDAEKALVTEETSVLIAAALNISTYEAGLIEAEERANAEACDALINALITEVNADNYDAAVSAYNAAKAAYDALNENEKGYLTADAAKLATAKAAIDAYVPVEETSEGETSVVTSEPETSTPTTSEEPTEPGKGCMGSIAAFGMLVSMLSLAGIALVSKRKN